MACWRNLSMALLAAIAALNTCAPGVGQSLRILPEIQQTNAEVEIEAVPADQEPLTEAPFVEPEQDWVTSEFAPDEDYEAYEDECPPGVRGAGHRLRRRWHHTRHDASELFERLRAPERTRSWTNRPLSISSFVGGMFGTELISGRVDQEPGVFVGGRIGWDFAEYWGLETRLGLVEMNLRAEDPAVFLDKNEVTAWDFDFMYYPWGESRLRPFLTLGLGLLQHNFTDDTGYRAKDTLFAIPIGIGAKYRIDQRLALRFDLTNHYAFAGGHDIESTNNIAITAGLELRFGGRRKSYWPWEPSRTWW
jgi:hypothetical protein